MQPLLAKTGQVDVDAVLRGDPSAFEELVRQESPRLYRVIYRILRDEDESRSILQETFLQAFRGLASFRGESKLTTWLYGIGINLARAALRRRQRYTALQDEELDRLQPSFEQGKYAETPGAWVPDRFTEEEERKRIVHAAIERLPEAYRTVLILRDIEEWSTEEAAEALGMTEGAVRVRLHRARQALRTLLDPYFKR